MRYLIVWLFVSFCLGIIIGNILPFNFFFFVSFCLGFLLSALFFYKKKLTFLFEVSILLFFLSLGSVWIKPYDVILPETLFDREVTVHGTIDTVPKLYHNFKTYYIQPNYIFSDSHGVYYPHAIFVKDYSKTRISYLDVYCFKGRLVKKYYKITGCTLFIKGESPPFMVKETGGFRKFAFNFSEKIATIITDHFPKNIQPFILGIFLGRREVLLNHLKTIFARAGTSHILAISGLHVGIVAWLILFILKVFGLKYNSRLLISIVLIFFYAFMCGLRSPVLRASTMFLCYAVSVLSKRKFLVFNALSLAGIIDLLRRPTNLYTVSFQLSFVAVFFIALGFRFSHLIFYKKRPPYFLGNIKNLFLMSLYANIGLIPLISFYFGKIYLVSIFTNILIIPYLGLIFSSLFVFLLSYFVAPLQKFIMLACSFLIILFLRINHFLSNLAFSFFEHRFSGSAIFLYYLFIFMVILLVGFMPGKKRRFS